MNFGIGLSAFANGLNQGISAGEKIGGLIQKGQMKGVRDKAVKDAEGERESAIGNLIQTGSASSADNTMTIPTYNVGDQKFNDMGSARKAAESQVPSADDFYMKSVVPKIADAYMKQGNIEQAEKWNSWAEQKSTKAGMKHWTKALQAGQIGDFKSYADNMVKAYNAQGYYDDGLEADGYDLVKDKEGNTTGLTLNLRNKSTGEKFSQTIQGREDMVRMGIGLLDPANAFKTTQAAVIAAKASRAKSEEGELKFKREVYLDDRKGERQEKLQGQRDESALERLSAGKQMDAANKRQEIAYKSQVENLFKKGTDPDEAVKQVYLAAKRDNTDPLGKQLKSDEELVSEARNVVNTIYSGAKKGNPMSGGLLPQAESSRPAKGTLMFYDRNTGKMVPDPR